MAKSSAKHRKSAKSGQISPSPAGKIHDTGHHGAMVPIIAATVALIGLATAFIVLMGPCVGFHNMDANRPTQVPPPRQAPLSTQKQVDERADTPEIPETPNDISQELHAPSTDKMNDFEEVFLKQIQPRDITVNGRSVKVKELTGNKQQPVPRAASIRSVIYAINLQAL